MCPRHGAYPRRRPHPADRRRPSQGSALDWSAARTIDPALPVLGLPRPVLYREVLTLAADYDHVVLDGPPQVADVTPLSGHGQ